MGEIEQLMVIANVCKVQCEHAWMTASNKYQRMLTIEGVMANVWC